MNTSMKKWSDVFEIKYIKLIYDDTKSSIQWIDEFSYEWEVLLWCVHEKNKDDIKESNSIWTCFWQSKPQQLKKFGQLYRIELKIIYQIYSNKKNK